MWPWRLRVAKGANLTDADSWRFGEKEAVLGRGFGPWTEHDSFMVGETLRRVGFALGGLSSSRYADPVADGTTPVCRTEKCQ